MIEIVKQIHHGWKELDDIIRIKPDFSVKPMFEKWQYIYSQNDVKFSLVQFTSRMYGEWCWEIYQLEGVKQLLEDVERFTTKENAEKRIRELMEADK